MSRPKGDEQMTVAEDVGRVAAKQLLTEIYKVENHLHNDILL